MAGYLSAYVTVGAESRPSFDSDGSITARTFPKFGLPVSNIDGIGALNAMVRQIDSANATDTGTGTLTATTSARVQIAASDTGVGVLSAAATPSYARDAALSGGSVLSASTLPRRLVDAAFSGGGTMTATTSKIERPTYKWASIASGNSLVLPSHSPGDTIVIFAYRNTAISSVGKPAASGTVPAWTDISSGFAGDGNSGRTAYFKATASNHTSGTWTNATGIAAVIISGPAVLGGNAIGSQLTEMCMAPTITMRVSDGRSLLLQMYGVIKTSSVWNAPAAGYTRRVDSNGNICINTKDVTTSGGGTTQSLNMSSGSIGTQIEFAPA